MANPLELTGGSAGNAETTVGAIFFNEVQPGPGASGSLFPKAPSTFDTGNMNLTMASFPGADALLTGLGAAAPEHFCAAAEETPDDDAAIAAAFTALANNPNTRFSRQGDRLTITLPAATFIPTPGQGPWVQGVHMAQTITANISDGGPNGQFELSGISGIGIGGRDDWTHWGLSRIRINGDQLVARAGYGIHVDQDPVDLGAGGGAAVRAEITRRLGGR